MNHETQHLTDSSKVSFGAHLKLAREALGQESKEVASQLRLNEKYIHMMEQESFPENLPLTFISGYLRAYGRLLQLPTEEIEQAIDQIKTKLLKSHSSSFILKSYKPIPNDSYFMQFSTYLIVFIVLGLAGTWWYTHPPSNLQQLVETPKIIQETVKPVLAQVTPSENNSPHKINITSTSSKSPAASDKSDTTDDDADDNDTSD
ncbi:MAG: hypothetical protein A3F11_07985 [Gammaproteobacteria bacterium RIFCSPHIGHO2_12_FULL_37_14]|nr:MAG: hypothetical protein A3F11_07985 [Gammaproteobacteria bacterium RIFCSPHIGHO2_12_FULL_37_14]